MKYVKKLFFFLILVSFSVKGFSQNTLFKTLYPPFDNKTHREAEKQ